MFVARPRSTSAPGASVCLEAVLGQRVGLGSRRCPLTGELIRTRSNGDTARMNAFAVEADAVWVVVGDVHLGFTARGNGDCEREMIALGFPASLVGAKLRVVIGLGETDATAWLWCNQRPPEPGFGGVVADADHDTHHPVSHTAVSKVIEGVHDGGLQAEFVVP